MLPGSVSALTRVQPPDDARLRLPASAWRVAAAFVALGLALSACNLTRNATAPVHPRVLGAPSGTPAVVGQPAPFGTGSLGAVSCGAPGRCWAAGLSDPNPAPDTTAATVIVATSDGGATWRAEHVVGGSVPQLSGISCPDTTRCMAVGTSGTSPGTGVVVRTLDAGKTWSPATSPPGALVLAAVSCAGPGTCMAIAIGATSTSIARTNDFGTTWQSGGALPPSFSPGGGLACTLAATCLIAGSVPTGNGHGQGAVAVSGDDGQTWALATVPSGTGVLRSVACPTPSGCLVAGTMSTTLSDVVATRGVVLRSSDGGHTWENATVPPVDDVYSLACPSDEQCAMVGGHWVGFPAVGTGAVAMSTNGGTTFSSATTSYAPLPLAAVDCPTVSRCVAVGGDTVARITLASPAPRRTPGRQQALDAPGSRGSR